MTVPPDSRRIRTVGFGMASRSSRTTVVAPVVAVIVVTLAAGAAASLAAVSLAAVSLAVAAGSGTAGPWTGPSVLPVRDSGSIGRLDLVARIQAELTRRGYAIGPINGVPGQRTLAAIRAYQQSRRLIPDDGRPTEDLFRIMQRESAATGHYGQPAAPAAGRHYATPPAAAFPAATGARPAVAPRAAISPAVPPTVPPAAPPAVTAAAGLSRATPPAPAASPARRVQTPRSFVPRRRLVELIQTYLSRKGYDAGVVDGLYGRRTAAAIRAYQRDTGLSPDGLATIGLYNAMQADALEDRQPPPPARAVTPGVATLDLLPPPGPVGDSAASPPDPTPLPQPTPLPVHPVPERAIPMAPGADTAASAATTAAARAPVPERLDRVPAPTDTGAIAPRPPIPQNGPATATIPIPASTLPAATVVRAVPALPPSAARPAADIAGDARPVSSSAGARSVPPQPAAADPAVDLLAPPPPDDDRTAQPQQEAPSGPPPGPAARIEPLPEPLPQPPPHASQQPVLEAALPLAPDDPVATGSALPFSVSVEAPPPRTDAALRIAGTTWRLTDDNGASQIMTFEADGSISGTDFDAFVTWRQFGDSIQIQYDNGFGRAVYREGRFDNGVLAGEGRSDAGSRWRWTAERLTSRR